MSSYLAASHCPTYDSKSSSVADSAGKLRISYLDFSQETVLLQMIEGAQPTASLLVQQALYNVQLNQKLKSLNLTHL